jgi:hypothetical protein
MRSISRIVGIVLRALRMRSLLQAPRPKNAIRQGEDATERSRRMVTQCKVVPYRRFRRVAARLELPIALLNALFITNRRRAGKSAVDLLAWDHPSDARLDCRLDYGSSVSPAVRDVVPAAGLAFISRLTPSPSSDYVDYRDAQVARSPVERFDGDLKLRSLV